MAASSELERIARKLRARVERALEAEWFAEEVERLYGLPRLSLGEFQRAMRLKAELLREFRGAQLQEFYETQEVENEYGTCLAITHRLAPESFAIEDVLNPDRGLAALRSELRLLHGIGPWIASHLRAQGIRALEDLVEHPRWGREALQLLSWLRRRDVKNLQRVVQRWLPVSHPLNLQLVGLVPTERLRWLDLETLGLFGRPVVLLGVARLEDQSFAITQYLARDITEELPALIELLRALGEEPALITYNGRAFDLHVVEERLGYYGLLVEGDLEPVHFDLLPHARRRFREELPDARLETGEKRLGLRRLLDLPSALVPDFYNTYLETGNVGVLVPIIEHNKHDLLALLVLLRELIGHGHTDS
jgi:hypothetical protein